MSPEDIRLLATVGIETAVAAGNVLIERGQPGAGLFVVLEGTVVVETTDGTVELGPDALIGERALLSADGLRTARVRALSDVRLLAVERVDFDRLCGDDPGLAGRLAAEHG
jgi:CRP-like cAMP-binding protein